MEIDVGKSLAHNSCVTAPWSFSKGQTNKLASKHSSSNPVFKQFYGENRHFVKPDTKRPTTSVFPVAHVFFVSDYCWSGTILNSNSCTCFLMRMTQKYVLGNNKIRSRFGRKIIKTLRKFEPVTTNRFSHIQKLNYKK